MSLAEAVNDQGASARALYEKLEDRVLARDQVGASECYYDLVRDGRPLPEMLREAVRIHGPYTHVPYHERIDNGFVNFVNNEAPGHYARGMAPQNGAPPKPAVHWPDQEPERLDGPLRDRLDQWMTLVH